MGDQAASVSREPLLSLPCVRVCAGQQEEGAPQQVASCLDRCDEAYFPGMPCYCNEACSQYENCCFDYYHECQGEASSHHSSALASLIGCTKVSTATLFDTAL